MNTAERIDEFPEITDTELQAMMEEAGAVTLSPLIEPALRSIFELLKAMSSQPAIAVIAATMFAGAMGATATGKLTPAEVRDLQVRVINRLYERRDALIKQRTLH